MPPIITIPQRLCKFPTHRGFVVHYTVAWNDDGTPNFGSMREYRRRECWRKNLCHLCGQRMERPYIFIGGPLCVKYRRFVDGPMHVECADYATQACPFLSNAVFVANSPVISETPFDIREVDGAMRVQGAYERRDQHPDRMAYVTTPSYAVQVNREANEYSRMGGPHAINPFALGQWCAVLPPEMTVDWDRMPKKDS